MLAEKYFKMRNLEDEFEDEVLSRGLSQAPQILMQTEELTKTIDDTKDMIGMFVAGILIMGGAVTALLAMKTDLGKYIINALKLILPKDIKESAKGVSDKIIQARDNIITPIVERQAAFAPSTNARYPSNMRTSEMMRNNIKKLEGLSLTAYKDESTYSIGYGHAGAKPGQKITEAQAEALFNQDIGRFEKAVQTYVKVPITQNQFDALVSLSYNIGIDAFRKSTLLKKLNQGDYAGAQKEFGRWVYGDNKRVISALVKRRKAEADLFGKDIVNIQSNPIANKIEAEKIVKKARDMITETRSSGWCAKRVHDVLEHGLGIKGIARRPSACDYIDEFQKHSQFIEISPVSVQPGDIVVYDKRGKHIHGHIFISDGGLNSGWSDFKGQQLKNPSEYGTVHVFRYVGNQKPSVQDLAQKNAVLTSQNSAKITKAKNDKQKFLNQVAPATNKTVNTISRIIPPAFAVPGLALMVFGDKMDKPRAKKVSRNN